MGFQKHQGTALCILPFKLMVKSPLTSLGPERRHLLENPANAFLLFMGIYREHFSSLRMWAMLKAWKGLWNTVLKESYVEYPEEKKKKNPSVLRWNVIAA